MSITDTAADTLMEDVVQLKGALRDIRDCVKARAAATRWAEQVMSNLNHKED